MKLLKASQVRVAMGDGFAPASVLRHLTTLAGGSPHPNGLRSFPPRVDLGMQPVASVGSTDCTSTRAESHAAHNATPVMSGDGFLAPAVVRHLRD